MPYTRSGKCVYKKKTDGSQGKKKGCSDSEEKAKKYMSKLYSLDETDLDETDPMFLGGGAAEEEDPMGEAVLREYIRAQLLFERGKVMPMADFRQLIQAKVSGDNITSLFDLAISEDADCSDYGKNPRSQILTPPAGRGTKDEPVQGPHELGQRPGHVQQCMAQEKLKTALVEDPALAQILMDNVGSKTKRKLAFAFILTSECCNDFEKLLALMGKSMPEKEKLAEILKFVEGKFPKELFGSSAGKVGAQIKKLLGPVTNRLDNLAFDQVREIIAGKLAEKLYKLIGTKDGRKAHPELTPEMIEDFRKQMKTKQSSQSRGNQTRIGFEGSFADPIKPALKEVTHPTKTTWEQDLADAIETGFGRTSGDAGVIVVPIGRRSQNNIWTGGDYPGYLVIPSMLQKYIVDKSGKLTIGEDAALMKRLADAKLIKAVLVLMQTSAGIQNEMDASKDLADATKAGPVVLSIPVPGTDSQGKKRLPLKINLMGAAHSSNEENDPAIAAAMASAIKNTTGGSNAAKPDMWFKVVDPKGGFEVVGVSLKQKNAGSLLSGDDLLRPFVEASLKIAERDPKLKSALKAGDVMFSLKDEGIGEDIAYAAAFGGGSNTVKYVLKGDFGKAVPKLNPQTNELEYPPGTVMAFTSLDELKDGVGEFPKLVFRSGEKKLDKEGKQTFRGSALLKDPDGTPIKGIRPIITYEKRAAAKDSTDNVVNTQEWKDAAKEVLANMNQTVKTEVALRSFARSQMRLMETRRYAKSQVGLLKERLIIEELTGTDRSDIKRMIKKEIEGTTNKREIERAFNKKFDVELKKALGASFFGTPGKINKFVVDQIYDEVNKWLADTATRNEIADITKQVLVKLYRELSFSSPAIIKRIKV